VTGTYLKRTLCLFLKSVSHRYRLRATFFCLELQKKAKKPIVPKHRRTKRRPVPLRASNNNGFSDRPSLAYRKARLPCLAPAGLNIAILQCSAR